MSYQGAEVPIIFGDFGLVGSDAQTDLPPGALILNENVMYEANQLVPALGTRQYNASPLSAAVVGLCDWFPKPDLQRLIAVSWDHGLADGKIYRDDGAGTFPTVMRSALATGSLTSFAAAGEEQVGNNRKLFITLTAGKVQVVDGDAAVTRDIGANAPAEWVSTYPPSGLFAHAARLWAVAGDRVYFSSVLDHENFVDTANGAGSQVVGLGVGQRLECGLPFKEQVFLFRWPKGIFLYDTRPTAVTDWLPTELTRAIGIAGPRAAAVGGDEIVFVSETGHIHLLSNVRLNDVLASDLVAANNLSDWWKDHISQSVQPLRHAIVRYYPARAEFHCALPAAGADINSIRMVVDMKKPGTPRLYLVNTKNTIQSLETRMAATRAEQLILGDSAGTVWTADEDERINGAAAYACTFQTPHDDFAWADASLRTRRKNLAFLELLGVPTGAFTMNVDVFLDGALSQTVPFAMTSGHGSLLGSFILGTDILGGGGPLAVRHKIRGSGRRVSLRGRFIANSTTFRVAGFVVSFTAGGHRP